MRERNSRRRVLIWALLVAFASGFAVAQSDKADTADNEAAERQRLRESGENADVVYTTDYLKQRFSGKSDTPPAVYTNESLNEPSEPPAPASAGAFTNEDLKQRFGVAKPAEADKADVDAAAESGAPETAAEPTAEGAPAPLSAEEKAHRIAEIDGELERLERRLRAIRNPLIGGTVPPTPDEQTQEAGLDNVERLRRTEAKIDELEAALAELRAPSKDRPDE